MKLRFLCANHRLELQTNMDKALKFCHTGFDTGQFYSDRSQWAEAIPHLGCAFEVSDILITHSSIDKEVSCDWLTTSAQLLAHSLKKAHYSGESEGVIWMAINRLEQQLSQNSSQVIWIDRYLGSLYGDLNTRFTMGSVAAENSVARVSSSDVAALAH